MKKLLSCTKTAVILLLAALLCLGALAFILARPISYGMSYHTESTTNGITFEGTLIFDPDGTMLVKNPNFDMETKYRYYYKDGYVFTLLAQTDEEYDAEVAYINENFESALKTPFYSAKIDAFKQVAEEISGYAMIYTCQTAINLTIALGAISLALAILTVTSFILGKKARSLKQD